MITRKNPFFFWINSLHKPTFFAVCALMLIGLILSYSLSYAAGEKIGLKGTSFFVKQFIFTCCAFFIIIILSFQPSTRLKVFIFTCFFLSLCGLIMTLFGVEIKGAKRWINFGGFSFQPSEFLKPFFIYVFSFLFAILQIAPLKYEKLKKLHLFIIIFAIYALLVFFLALQPDFGMILTFTLLLVALFYINLKNLKFFVAGACVLAILAFIIGSSLNHVKTRVKTFFYGQENFQAKLASKAVQSGGFFGRGFAESQLKFNLPEAHNDFIFAILIEEFGFIFAAILGLIFIFLILSNFV